MFGCFKWRKPDGCLSCVCQHSVVELGLALKVVYVVVLVLGCTSTDTRVCVAVLVPLLPSYLSPL